LQHRPGHPLDAVAKRHQVDFQISTRQDRIAGFAPLPLRWRIEATFDTATNRYRRLTRNLEQYARYAENAYEIASFCRVPRVYTRDVIDSA
jgi:transposase